MELVITLDNSGDHPLFVFLLTSVDKKYKIETVHRFAACREFHRAFILKSSVKIKSPFPDTKRRSSLGIKLSEDLLKERTSKLNNYMKEVLERFPSLASSEQNGFVSLLDAQIVPTKYFTKEVDHSSENCESNASARLLRVSDDKLNYDQTKSFVDVQISLYSTDEHPLYKIRVSTRNKEYVVEHKMRFASFRDFYNEELEKYNVMISSQFPPTKAARAIGIQLSDEELKKRASGLNKFMNEAVSKYSEYPPSVQSSLIKFLKAENIPTSYFYPTSLEVEPRPQQADKGSKSLSKKLIHQLSSKDAVEPTDKKPAARSLSVQVSRSSIQARNVKYDVIIRLFQGHDVLITACSRPFKEFRQLESDIQANLEELEETIQALVPSFPETFSRSRFGISLPETELVKRVRGLDAWMRSVTKYYQFLSEKSQRLVSHFLNLDCLINNEKYESIIQDLLKTGKVGEQSHDSPSINLVKPTDGSGKYAAVRTAENSSSNDIADDISSSNSSKKEKEKPTDWTIIEGSPPPPKGCCTVS